MTEPTYDPETCVTAGELRVQGLPIPDEIPDFAWVPISSISYGVEVSKAVSDEDRAVRVLSPVINIDFGEPFHWIKVSGTIKI